MPYHLAGTSLGAVFVLIWAFIGLMMLRDQLLAARNQRLEKSAEEQAWRGPGPTRGRRARRMARA